MNESSTEIREISSDYCELTNESSQQNSSQIRRVIVEGSMENAERARQLLRV